MFFYTMITMYVITCNILMRKEHWWIWIQILPVILRWFSNFMELKKKQKLSKGYILEYFLYFLLNVAYSFQWERLVTSIGYLLFINL